MTISNIFALTNGTNQSSVGNSLAGFGKVTGTASADGVFTPVKNGVGAAAMPSLPRSVDGATDKVELSGLAQALTGRAAEFFNHMDDKERSALETLVKSGKVSVDDAVQGLEFWADEVTFSKAMSMVEPTPQEREEANQRNAARSTFDASFEDFAKINKENEALNEEYVKAVETGSGDLASIRERLDAVSQRYQTASANARRSRDDIGDTGLAIQSAFERRSNVVAEAKAASGHPDGAARSNAQNKAAADRLAEAGLDQLTLKNARRSFAASITEFPY